MPGSNVLWGPPVVRLNPWYPSGQMGVPGASNSTGERLHCTGKIFYVDPNYPGTSDQRDGTDPTCPLTTIAAAIAMTTDYAGDVIVVMQNADWQYAGGTVYTTGVNETVTLDRAGVRIVGLSPGGMGVPWSPAANGEICLSITAMDCQVEGFLFNAGAFAGADGVYVEWDGVLTWGDNAVIRHCFFDDSIDTAIELEFAWYCDVYDNVFSECDVYGIYAAAIGSGCSYALIHDNEFHDVGTAAVALLGGGADNHIFNNRFYNANAQAAGAATNEGINTTGGSGNFVTNNWFSCLLPVPAAGDLNDLCTAAATDAWAGNHCMNGLVVLNPT